MTSNRQMRASRGAGFTLVEMLVVIVIIGMLAGLTTTVLVSARRSVRNSVVASEEAQLSMALDEYKNRYGEYPPDLSDDEAVLRHIKKRWPRYNVTLETFRNHIEIGCRISSGSYNGPINDGNLNGQHVWNPKSYISSLVFWLGGLPDANGIPSGFYANPKAPLGIDANGRYINWRRAAREKPLFSFDRKSLAAVQISNVDGYDVAYVVEDDSLLWDDGISAYVYAPAICQGDLPILYFKPSYNSGYQNKGLYFADDINDVATMSYATPYARDVNNGVWYEERRFQLIHPGADALFGVPYSDPNGRGVDITLPKGTQPKTNCYIEDDDNIVNFAENGVLVGEYQDVVGN